VHVPGAESVTASPGDRVGCNTRYDAAPAERRGFDLAWKPPLWNPVPIGSNKLSLSFSSRFSF